MTCNFGRGGRPRLPDSQRRHLFIRFRANAQERSTLEAQARRHGLPVGVYVRRRALNLRVVERPSDTQAKLAVRVGEITQQMEQLVREGSLRGINIQPLLQELYTVEQELLGVGRASPQR